ncbi:HNH endonuclease signature motif containing protein [soil metagenome]
MSSTATSFAAAGMSPAQRLEVLFDELSELAGQRNAIDGRIVEIVAEIDHDGLAGNTGCRSVAALVAWRLGMSSANAGTIATIAHRLAEFPRCVAGMREGRFSLDQIGVIANKAADGSDEHYAQLAERASVTQLRTAIKLEPRPEPQQQPEPAAEPEPPRSITHTSDEYSSTWYITLPHDEAAMFDAALQSHQDRLVAEWKRIHTGGVSEHTPPFPNAVDGFMSLVHAGWDTDVAARPHGQRTTAVMHVDVESRIAALHLGPLLSDDDRRYMLCDATCEVWFERAGQVIGSGRETRTISRRLRRALEHRDHGTCVVPGCGATRGLHAHHIKHWEDGGLTELANLVLLCPFHHRLHHRGGITITGPADRLMVTDASGRTLEPGSLARPPTTPPPDVPPCSGPTGERADWWWYTPFQPPPTTTN